MLVKSLKGANLKMTDLIDAEQTKPGDEVGVPRA